MKHIFKFFLAVFILICFIACAKKADVINTGPISNPTPINIIGKYRGTMTDVNIFITDQNKTDTNIDIEFKADTIVTSSNTILVDQTGPYYLYSDLSSWGLKNNKFTAKLFISYIGGTFIFILTSTAITKDKIEGTLIRKDGDSNPINGSFSFTKISP